MITTPLLIWMIIMIAKNLVTDIRLKNHETRIQDIERVWSVQIKSCKEAAERVKR